MVKKHNLARVLELVLLTLGVVCLGITMHAGMASARAQTQALDVVHSWKGQPPDNTDQSLWSAQRINAHSQAIAQTDGATPVAAITIPELDLEVAVFEGTSETILNIGAGRVIGTAPIGTDGNIGIAAHRDGYFRSLKDISVGHEIVIQHPRGVDRYAVTGVQIVEPHDVSVLEQNGSPELTLITCYPFYFVGDAPQRFIVQAERIERPFKISNP